MLDLDAQPFDPVMIAQAVARSMASPRWRVLPVRRLAIVRQVIVSGVFTVLMLWASVYVLSSLYHGAVWVPRWFPDAWVVGPTYQGFVIIDFLAVCVALVSLIIVWIEPVSLLWQQHERMLIFTPQGVVVIRGARVSGAPFFQVSDVVIERDTARLRLRAGGAYSIDHLSLYGPRQEIAEALMTGMGVARGYIRRY